MELRILQGREVIQVLQVPAGVIRVRREVILVRVPHLKVIRVRRELILRQVHRNRIHPLPHQNHPLRCQQRALIQKPVLQKK